jgi:predicted  nucleic acid-binding Zn-ribbon protein
MTRLENAQERLDAALAKLEQASTGHTADLERELAATRDHCVSLKDRNQNIAQKLDVVIARIHTLLEDRTG